MKVFIVRINESCAYEIFFHDTTIHISLENVSTHLMTWYNNWCILNNYPFEWNKREMNCSFPTSEIFTIEYISDILKYNTSNDKFILFHSETECVDLPETKIELEIGYFDMNQFIMKPLQL